MLRKHTTWKFIILKQDSNVVISQFCLKRNQYVNFFCCHIFLFILFLHIFRKISFLFAKNPIMLNLLNSKPKYFYYNIEFWRESKANKKYTQKYPWRYLSYFCVCVFVFVCFFKNFFLIFFFWKYIVWDTFLWYIISNAK